MRFARRGVNALRQERYRWLGGAGRQLIKPMVLCENKSY